MTIGKFIGNNAEFLDGDIDEFYIFTSALMHAEVEALMKKCEFPSDSKYNSFRRRAGLFNSRLTLTKFVSLLLFNLCRFETIQTHTEGQRI